MRSKSAFTTDNESVRWFQQQIEELKREKDDLDEENVDKENRLVEHRKAMAALPSPDEVECRCVPQQRLKTMLEPLVGRYL